VSNGTIFLKQNYANYKSSSKLCYFITKAIAKFSEYYLQSTLFWSQSLPCDFRDAVEIMQLATHASILHACTGVSITPKSIMHIGFPYFHKIHKCPPYFMKISKWPLFSFNLRFLPSSYFRSIYAFCLRIIFVQFTLFAFLLFSFNLRFLPSPYFFQFTLFAFPLFDHDSFVHHALHALDAPVRALRRDEWREVTDGKYRAGIILLMISWDWLRSRKRRFRSKRAVDRYSIFSSNKSWMTFPCQRV